MNQLAEINAQHVTTIAALEAKCAALAAENAGLKEWSPNPHSASMFEAIEKAEALMDDGMPELAMIEAFEILKMKRTPATDAFLAEVRASALEYYANLFKDTVNMDVKHNQEFHKGTLYVADQFRKGAAQ